MNNGQLDTSAIIGAGILAAIGVILIALGKRKGKRTLRIYGSAFIAGAVVYLFVLWADLREILTALAAMAAVFIAAYSIDESSRMRQDSIDREKRDRKERLLNEVTEWLRELEARIYPGLDKLGSTAREAGTADSITKVDRLFDLYRMDIALANADALVSSILGAQYYQRLASKSDERLSNSIEVIVNGLDGRLQLVREEMKSPRDTKKLAPELSDEEKSKLMDELIENADRPLEDLNLSEEAIRTIRLGRNARAIRKAILDAVDRVIELKTSLIVIG